MNLKGKQTYNASAQQLWDILMDVDKLTKITPGVSKLELVGDNQYNAISEVKIGPVKGAFKGDLELLDINEPSQFTLKVKQLSKIGNADATVQISINQLNEQESELSFDGKAKLSGTLARTGQRVLTGVANSLTKQFFAALGEELEIIDQSPSSSSEETIPTGSETTRQEVKGQTEIETPTAIEQSSSSSKGLFASLMDWIMGLFGKK